MSVRLMLITHGEVGQALLEAVTTTLGELPLATLTMAIAADGDPETLGPRLSRFVASLENHQELLILTDLFGATPTNIACQVNHAPNVKVVSGLNLPMLIRVMNYPELNLNDLVAKAVSGGQDGILCCEDPHD